jgi:hypothetical protein
MSYVRDAVQKSREIGDNWTPMLCLEGAAATLARARSQAAAGRVLARADAQREQIGLSLEVAEQELHDETVALVSRHLHEPAVATAWAEGKALSVEEALASVLE